MRKEKNYSLALSKKTATESAAVFFISMYIYIQNHSIFLSFQSQHVFFIFL